MKLSLLYGPPNSAQRERWEHAKARGKRAYAWRYGVLGFGGFMFTLMMLLHLLQRISSARGVANSDYIYIVANLLIWPLAGYSWCTFMWRSYEDYFSEGKGRLEKGIGRH